jgi:hypothetical protein
LVSAAVVLQVLDDGRIKHFFAGTDMKKQVSCAPEIVSTAVFCAAFLRGHALPAKHLTTACNMISGMHPHWCSSGSFDTHACMLWGSIIQVKAIFCLADHFTAPTPTHVCKLPPHLTRQLPCTPTCSVPTKPPSRPTSCLHPTTLVALPPHHNLPFFSAAAACSVRTKPPS